MINLTPKILEHNGEKLFVVLSFEEYEALLEHLEDLQDLCDLRAAKLENLGKPTIPLEEAKRELGIRDSPQETRKVSAKTSAGTNR